MSTIDADSLAVDGDGVTLEVSDDRVLVSHDLRGEVELGTTVTSAVALLTGRPPEAVGSDLSESVEIDALDRLFRPRAAGVPSTDGRLVLSVGDCSVTVTSTGLVTVERRSSADSVE